MARGSEYDREQRAKDPNYDKKRAFAAKQRRVLAKQAEEQRKENRRQELAAMQHVLAGQRLVAQQQRAVLAEGVLEVIAAEKSGGLNESASPASPAAGFPSPGSSISTASASPSHPCARSTPPSVLRSRVGELSKELDKAASEVARLEQELDERQQRAAQAEASKIARAGEVSLVASHLLQSRDLLQQMQEHAEAETLRADKAEAKIKVMAQRPASPSKKGPGPRARVPLLRDTEAQEQLSQCLAELAQEREAKEEAQEQLASRQQQLDAVSKAKQELRDELTREQDVSRKLKSANEQFLSEEARVAKSIERLRDERNRLREECNELKQTRAPAVPPLRENNGQHA